MLFYRISELGRSYILGNKFGSRCVSFVKPLKLSSAFDGKYDTLSYRKFSRIFLRTWKRKLEFRPYKGELALFAECVGMSKLRKIPKSCKGFPDPPLDSWSSVPLPEYQLPKVNSSKVQLTQKKI